MASQVKDAAWYGWIARLMGLESRQTYTAMLAPSRFHCVLDELPWHLIPLRKRQSRRSPDVCNQELFLNPQCSILPSGQLPAAVEPQRHLLDRFELQGTIAWVPNPDTGCLQPFWLGPRLEAMLSHLRAGEIVPDNVPAAICNLLVNAGVFITEKYTEQVRKRYEITRKAAKQFREKEYAPIGELIHPFHLAALRRYYRYAIRHGYFRLGDDQSSRRHVAHNDSVARFFHHQITNAVSAIVGVPVKPSYVYLASYLSGAELKRHTDREQCEFSVTLCLDFSPEPDGATPWPIQLDTSDGTVTAYQALGDGLIYRGTKLPHYRRVLGEGHSSTSIFFHYVPIDFPGSLD